MTAGRVIISLLAFGDKPNKYALIRSSLIINFLLIIAKIAK